ncbi:MCM2 [Enterospora canceri]|uniref:DNA helicase n=1 Tax=Enterospora canceri TaxID=1081671 RepID=A0A1Y1S9N6_9MICR|nr:MCM2 [Enterospora canceri]
MNYEDDDSTITSQSSLDPHTTTTEDVAEIPANQPMTEQPLATLLAEFLNKNYLDAIREMCAANKEAIDIEYNDLIANENIKEHLDANAELFIDSLSEALKKVTLQYFPNYLNIKSVLYGHIIGLPVIEEIRALRNEHLNRLIRITGVVTKRHQLQSKVKIAYFTCTACKAVTGPYKVETNLKVTCFECQNGSKMILNAPRSHYEDVQKIVVQEMPGTVPAGSLPRSREVVLFGDLIDRVKPGDEIDLCGLYRNVSLQQKNVSFPVFHTQIQACGLLHKKATKTENIDFKKMAADQNILTKLINSFAPSIYGYKNIKVALLLALVGGCRKEKEQMVLRGDINVLLLGDPSTAKSQFLRFVQSVAERGVLATGQGASAVGLTATVKRDHESKEWVLEGGALVLGDKGVVCIDEFDKINEVDRVAIHEAMEQQSISICKAGIVASLHARCSVVAAANPIRGNYTKNLSFSQNVNLSDPIISRFDILCVIRDEIDEKNDRELARRIIRNHFSEDESEDEGSGDRLSLNTLKAYLSYAKNNFSPTISEFNLSKLTQLYMDLRKHSMHSGIPITVRLIESVVRISEGFAKLRLSHTVENEDVEMAIKVALESFLSAQKYGIGQNLRKKFTKYLETDDDLLLWILKKMIHENDLINMQYNRNGSIKLDEYARRVKKNKINGSVDEFVGGERFKEEGFILTDGIIKYR